MGNEPNSPSSVTNAQFLSRTSPATIDAVVAAYDCIVRSVQPHLVDSVLDLKPVGVDLVLLP